MKVEEILARAPKNASKDLLMRYLYLELGKLYRRDINFFYGTDEEKRKIYNKRIKPDEDVDIICRSIARDIYVKIFKKVGIKAKWVNKATNSPFPHVDIIASPDDGKHWYYMNPMDDLYRIQGNLKTQRYGSRTRKYEGLSYYTEDELRDMDNKLGYTFHGMYMDEFFDMLRNELMNRSKIKNYLLADNPELSNRDLSKDFLLEYKMDFIMDHVAEFENMQGYIELKKYQREIFGRLFNQTERKKIEIYNLCRSGRENMQSVIELTLRSGNKYYITSNKHKGCKKVNAQQMIKYLESGEFHFLKEKKDLEQLEERE